MTTPSTCRDTTTKNSVFSKRVCSGAAERPPLFCIRNRKICIRNRKT